MGWRSPDYEPQGDRTEGIAVALLVAAVILLGIGLRLHARAAAHGAGRPVGVEAPLGR